MAIWVLIGYRAKRWATRRGWVSPWPDYPDVGFPCAAPVEEICSVSGCIARNAPSECDSDTVSPWGLYADPEQAQQATPVEEREQFAVYAYRLWTTQFELGSEELIDLWWAPDAIPIPKNFSRLGWDAVVGGNEHCFGCSPLSCNCGSDLVRCPELNRYCLVSDEQAAIQLARRFSIDQPEPGPYCVVEVWRESDAKRG